MGAITVERGLYRAVDVNVDVKMMRRTQTTIALRSRSLLKASELGKQTLLVPPTLSRDY